MPNINFWIRDMIYAEWVSLSPEVKKKLKEQWRASVEKAIK